jgi:hypothetical protein
VPVPQGIRAIVAGECFIPPRSNACGGGSEVVQMAALEARYDLEKFLKESPRKGCHRPATFCLKIAKSLRKSTICQTVDIIPAHSQPRDPGSNPRIGPNPGDNRSSGRALPCCALLGRELTCPEDVLRLDGTPPTPVGDSDRRPGPARAPGVIWSGNKSIVSERAMQVYAGAFPAAFDGAFGDAAHGGDFGGGEAAEEF